LEWLLLVRLVYRPHDPSKVVCHFVEAFLSVKLKGSSRSHTRLTLLYRPLQLYLDWCNFRQSLVCIVTLVVSQISRAIRLIHRRIT
jgi:hypothetical protein